MKKQFLFFTLIVSSIAFAQEGLPSLKTMCLDTILKKGLPCSSLTNELQEQIIFERKKRLLEQPLKERAKKLIVLSIFKAIPGFSFEEFSRNLCIQLVDTEAQLALRNKANDRIISSGHWYDGSSAFQTTTPDHTRFTYIHTNHPYIHEVIESLPKEDRPRANLFIDAYEKANKVGELIITERENGSCWIEAKDDPHLMRKALRELDAFTAKIFAEEQNNNNHE